MKKSAPIDGMCMYVCTQTQTQKHKSIHAYMYLTPALLIDCTTHTDTHTQTHTQIHTCIHVSYSCTADRLPNKISQT